MSKRRSGINPLAYRGAEPLSSPNVIVSDISPTIYDAFNVNISDLWFVNQAPLDELWILTDLDNDIATWVQLYPVTGSGASIFPTDSGIATQINGELQVLGGNNITTSGAGNTVTITLDDSVVETYTCDVGVATPALNSLSILGGDAVLTMGAGSTVTINLTNGSDGQLLIGGGAAPVWADVTSSGGTIAITGGPNTLNLEVGGPTLVSSFQTDSGTAVPVANTIEVLGSINIDTSAAGNTVTIDLANDVLLSGFLNVGTTTTAGTGLIVLAGGITATGTIDLNSLSAGVMQTNALGVVSSDNGANGELLIGGGSAPAWNNITSTGGTVTITNGANTINLENAGGGSIGTGPAFLGVSTASGSGLSTGYPFDDANALGEIFDQTASFFPGAAGLPATFTAPTTGRYVLNMGMTFRGSNAGPRRLIMRVVATSRTFQIEKQFDTTGASPFLHQTWSMIIDMNATDTATFYVQIGGMVVDNNLANTLTRYAWISGYRVA